MLQDEEVARHRHAQVRLQFQDVIALDLEEDLLDIISGKALHRFRVLDRADDIFAILLVGALILSHAGVAVLRKDEVAGTVQFKRRQEFHIDIIAIGFPDRCAFSCTLDSGLEIDDSFDIAALDMNLGAAR